MNETAFIQWRPHYSVGHKLIDRQHHFVIDVINDLYLSLRGDMSSGQFKMLMQRLQQYTRAHLGFEEKLLQECGYPDLNSHMALHQQMKSMSLEMERLSEVMDKDWARDLFDFLKSWWLHHILEEDMKYRKYLQSKP